MENGTYITSSDKVVKSMSKSRRMKQDERLTQMLMPRVMAATRYEMLKERHEKKQPKITITFPSSFYSFGWADYRSIFSEETTDASNNS